MITSHNNTQIDEHAEMGGIAENVREKEFKKVLILDDEKGIRSTLKMMLKYRYHVYEAKNGKETMEMVKNENIDLIISDVWLEEEDGLDVMEQILKVYKDMKFIVISAVTDDKLIERAHQLGAKYVLDKPFLVEEFREVVQDVLED